MLGERIRALRQKKGYTQEEIASRLHVTRQTISKWEKNYSVPDADLLVKLAEVLEVKTSQLLGGKEAEDEAAAGVKPDAYAQQLAHIAEQMAVRNRQSRRIWKIIGFVLAGVLGVAMIFAVLGAAAYTNLSIDSMIEAPFTAEE